MKCNFTQFKPQNFTPKQKVTAVSSDCMHTVMNTVLDGLIIIDHQSIIQSFNPSAEKIFGYETKEVIGQNVMMLMPEPYHSGHDGYIKNYLETGNKKVIGIGREVSGKRKDGSVFPMEIGLNEMQQGGARMFVGTVRDISSRKQAEEVLRLTEERYELAVQGLSVGVWDWDLITKQLYWSPRFREIARAAHDYTYHEWESRLHADDSSHVLEMLNGHLQKKGFFDVEYRFRRQDGSYIWVHDKGQAVWDAAGKPIRMVGSIEDITWHKQVEVERENMIAKLSESNSDLERFAYACSHDLQEPLRMISNFSERLQKHLGATLDEKGRHYIKYVISGAAHARQLISDVLNYARLDHETEQWANINSEKTLAGVLRDLSPRIEETKAIVTHDTLPEVCIQPTHLRQLLQNLIGNALKFCSEKPYVHIGAVQEGSMWCFYVRDNGIGIASEHQEKIFSVFQRLHSRECYPGTGIGLALCKKLVQKYGGRIWVESQPGKGSSFYFTLPPATRNQSKAA
jgi:PAS domain S-box-containing protein